MRLLLSTPVDCLLTEQRVAFNLPPAPIDRMRDSSLGRAPGPHPPGPAGRGTPEDAGLEQRAAARAAEIDKLIAEVSSGIAKPQVPGAVPATGTERDAGTSGSSTSSSTPAQAAVAAEKGDDAAEQQHASQNLNSFFTAGPSTAGADAAAEFAVRAAAINLPVLDPQLLSGANRAALPFSLAQHIFIDPSIRAAVSQAAFSPPPSEWATGPRAIGPSHSRTGGRPSTPTLL
jgi:hypothetical protein